jgi:VanZ family protein
MADKLAPRLRLFIKRAAFWLLWPAIAVIAWGELTPQPPHEISDLLGWDKAQHFVAYFGLSLMAVLGWSGRRALLLFLAVIALGGTLEILQAMVGRDAEWGDMLANTLGAAVGTLLALGLLAAARLVDRKRAY